MKNNAAAIHPTSHDAPMPESNSHDHRDAPTAKPPRKRKPKETLATPAPNDKAPPSSKKPWWIRVSLSSLWDRFSFTQQKSPKNTADRIRQQRGRLYAKSKIFLSVFAVLIVGSVVTALFGLPKKMVDHMTDALIAYSGSHGLDVKNVLVRGRKNVPVHDIMKTVNAKLNTPILSYPLTDIRNALLQNPWIKHVTVQRRLPNVLYIHVQERIPIALWQQRTGKHYLIDSEGVVMDAPIQANFHHLPIVAGKDAPIHAPQMVALIDRFPTIKTHITGMVRVRERRWNLTLNKTITVKLPEDHLEEAMARLRTLVEQDKLSSQHVVSVDMRLTGQIFIKMTDESAKLLKLSAKDRVKV